MHSSCTYYGASSFAKLPVFVEIIFSQHGRQLFLHISVYLDRFHIYSYIHYHLHNNIIFNMLLDRNHRSCMVNQIYWWNEVRLMWRNEGDLKCNTLYKADRNLISVSLFRSSLYSPYYTQWARNNRYADEWKVGWSVNDMIVTMEVNQGPGLVGTRMSVGRR